MCDGIECVATTKGLCEGGVVKKIDEGPDHTDTMWMDEVHTFARIVQIRNTGRLSST